MQELSAGVRARNFELPDEQTMPWILSGELEIGAVVLVFYGGDWSAYDNGQLAGLARGFEEFDRRRVNLAAISVDPPASSLALKNKLILPFPLLTDPYGEVARLYGLWNEREAEVRPGLVAIDADGTIRSTLVGDDLADRPTEDQISETIRSLKGRTPGARPARRLGEPEVQVTSDQVPEPDNSAPQVLSLERLVSYFDGAITATQILGSRLETRRRSRSTLAETERIGKTLRLYRDYLRETAWMHSLDF